MKLVGEKRLPLLLLCGGPWAGPGKEEVSFKIIVVLSSFVSPLSSHRKYQLGLMKPMVGSREKLLRSST